MDGQQTPAHNDGRREQQDNSSPHSNNTVATVTDRSSSGNDEGVATSATINIDGSTTDVRTANVAIRRSNPNRLPDVGSNNAGGRRLDCSNFQQPILSFPSQLCQYEDKKSTKEIQEEIFSILDQVEWILCTPPDDEIWSCHNKKEYLPLPQQ